MTGQPLNNDIPLNTMNNKTKDIVPAELVKQLLVHKKKTGISNEVLAMRIGVRLGTVARWFSGRNQNMHELTQQSVIRYLKNVNV